MKSSIELGQEQETRALKFFLKKGWKLLRRNYRSRMGEIDLILKDEEGIIVFVEVKYRHQDNFGSAQSAVSFHKQNRVIKTALQYIKESKLQGFSFRFDVMAISPQGIEHIPNAFSANGFTL